MYWQQSSQYAHYPSKKRENHSKKPFPRINVGFNGILRELPAPSNAGPLQVRCKSVIGPFIL